MQQYTLYSYYRSSCSWRVRLVLELKNLPYTLIQINLLENDQNCDEYLRVNPGGVVPALLLEDGNVLTQSVAIMEYLEEASESESDRGSASCCFLLPSDPIKRAHVRQLVQLIASDCQPLQNLHVLRKLRSLANLQNNEEAREIWGRPFIQKALLAYNKLISSTKGKFSVGDSASLADCCLIPQLYNARRFGINLETDFPHLLLIESNFKLLHPEVFEKAHPDNSQGSDR